MERCRLRLLPGRGQLDLALPGDGTCAYNIEATPDLTVLSGGEVK
jgi:hypothetical protein